MIDLARPYAYVLLAVLLLAVPAAGGWTGWALRGAQAEKEQAPLQARITSLESSLSGFIKVFDQVNVEAELAKKEAEAWRIRAHEEGKVAVQNHRRLVTKLQVLEAELEHARQDPGCRTQLEARVCAPLY